MSPSQLSILQSLNVNPATYHGMKVSGRSLGWLRTRGLIEKKEGVWWITDKGREEVGKSPAIPDSSGSVG